MVERKIPERRCVGCMTSFPKPALIRVVKLPTGSVELDFTGKKPGRGAYLCKNTECLKKARKAKRLERNLDISIPDAIYALLEVQLNENI